MGRVESVTGFSDNACTAGNERSGVLFAYDAWGSVAASYQDHADDADTGDPAVQYTYADGASGGEAAYVRLEKMTYPGASREVYYRYGSAGGTSDGLSRVNDLADSSGGATVYAAYTYLGAGTIVNVAHPAVTGGLNLTYGTSGTAYAGLDRFGRVVDQKWQNDTPTVLDQFKYGYDQASNRTWREVAPDGGNPTGFDEYYTYDGLQRLNNMDRGTLTGTPYSGIGGTPAKEEDWSLDALGNWPGYVRKTAGAETLNQAREHNAVNEIADTTADDDAIGETAGAKWIDPTHDAAGNMTRAPKPGVEGATGHTYTWDAWNHLVKVEEWTWTDDGDGVVEGGEIGAATVVAEYRYDGLARRIAKLIPNGNNWDRTDYYYNQGWQVLEERAETVASETAVADDVKIQYVWDIRYIDAPVCRDEDKNADGDCTDVGEETDPDEHLYYTNDANMNVTALVERKSGSVAERYVYDPYGSLLRDANGNPLVYSADWSTTVTWPNSKKNEILYCGYRFDPETGLYHVRYRHYHPTLGRWVNRDRIGYADGLSLCEYVSSEPLHMRDPYGMSKPDFKGALKRVAKGVTVEERPALRVQGDTDKECDKNTYGWPGYATATGTLSYFVTPWPGHADRGRIEGAIAYCEVKVTLTCRCTRGIFWDSYEWVNPQVDSVRGYELRYSMPDPDWDPDMPYEMRRLEDLYDMAKYVAALVLVLQPANAVDEAASRVTGDTGGEETLPSTLSGWVKGAFGKPDENGFLRRRPMQYKESAARKVCLGEAAPAGGQKK